MDRLTYPNMKADLELCRQQLKELCGEERKTAFRRIPPQRIDFDLQFAAAFKELQAYRDTGLMPDEIPHWIPVSKNLPEYDELLQRYEDSTMKLISVLACGYLDGDKELSTCEANRLLIKKTGIKQLDAQYTGKWEWSKHFKEVVYWQPLPQPPKGEKP